MIALKSYSGDCCLVEGEQIDHSQTKGLPMTSQDKKLHLDKMFKRIAIKRCIGLITYQTIYRLKLPEMFDSVWNEEY